MSLSVNTGPQVGTVETIVTSYIGEYGHEQVVNLTAPSTFEEYSFAR